MRFAQPDSIRIRPENRRLTSNDLRDTLPTPNYKRQAPRYSTLLAQPKPSGKRTRNLMRCQLRCCVWRHYLGVLPPLSTRPARYLQFPHYRDLQAEYHTSENGC